MSLVVSGTQSAPVVFQGWQGDRWLGIQQPHPGYDPVLDLRVEWLELSGANEGVKLRWLGTGSSIEIHDSQIVNCVNGGFEIIESYSSRTTDLLIETLSVQNSPDGVGIYVHMDDPATIRSSTATG